MSLAKSDAGWRSSVTRWARDPGVISSILIGGSTPKPRFTFKTYRSRRGFIHVVLCSGVSPDVPHWVTRFPKLQVAWIRDQLGALSQGSLRSKYTGSPMESAYISSIIFCISGGGSFRSPSRAASSDVK